VVERGRYRGAFKITRAARIHRHRFLHVQERAVLLAVVGKQIIGLRLALVDSRMGITILPASAVKHSVASVVACEILDHIPISEIAIAVSKRFRAPVVDNFRSFTLRSLGH
jgi:hypothetical protein